MRALALLLAALLTGCGREAPPRPRPSEAPPPRPADGHRITFAAYEKVPYIGETLQDGGYVAEVAREACRRAGLEAAFEFYPLERGLLLTREGRADAVLPLHAEAGDDAAYLYSEPFPGDTVVLARRRDNPLRPGADYRRDPAAFLASLRGATFGVVSGSLNARAFDQAGFLRKEYVRSDLLNLHKVLHGRVDFIAIDKYTAADLMVTQVPQAIGRLEVLDPPLETHDFRVAFSRAAPGCAEKREAFDRGLRSLARDGTLDRIRYRHGLMPFRKAGSAGVRLRIAAVANSDILVMRRLSAEYERRNPGVELEWHILDEHILRTRLLSDLAVSDGKYDICMIGALEAPIWARNGWLAPFRDFPADYDRADLIKEVAEGLSHEGVMYALPFYAESSMTYYRKDLFERRGLRMPERPTYDQVRAFAAALSDPAAGVYGIGLRGKPGWGENVAFLSTLVNAYGGRWFDERWNPELDSPPWREAIACYRDLMKEGPPGAEAHGFNENKQLFLDGRLAMWIDATCAAGPLFDPAVSKVADKVGFTHAPVERTGKGSHWLWSWALAVPASSRQAREARRFVLWATSKAYIERVGRTAGWVSVPPGTRYSTYRDPRYLRAAPFAKFVLAEIESADPRDPGLRPVPYAGIQFARIPEFPAIGARVGEEVADVVRGRQSVETALGHAQSAAQEQMRASGYLP